MLSVELYRTEEELYSFSYVKEPEFPIRIICPNPKIADLVRSKTANKRDITVDTISHFVSEKLDLVASEQGADVKIYRKSEIMMHLGTIFRKINPQGSYELFLQAFKLFTDFRSYTLDFNVLSNIFPAFNEDVSKAVQYFFKYAEAIDLIDEHRAYGIITENFGLMDNVIYRDDGDINYMFYGFPHMSAGQIDMMKSIGNRFDVYVPFAKNVFARSSPSDWIRWIDASIEVPEVEEQKLPKINICPFASARLSETLKKYHEANGTFDNYILATSTSDLNSISEIPIQKVNFSVQSKMFDDAVDEVVQSLKENLDNIDQFIEEQIVLCVAEEQFRKLKVYQVMKKTIAAWRDLSENNVRVEKFELELIKDIALLDLPRINLRPIEQERGATSEIVDIKEIARINPTSRNAIVVTSDYLGIKNTNEAYAPEVMKFLATISPVQRGEFDYLNKAAALINILKEPDAVLFLEQGILDNQVAWADIVDQFEQINYVSVAANDFSEPQDYLKLSSKNLTSKNIRISASRLQTYINCPRRYYYQYIETYDHDTEIVEGTTPALLGTIEHEVIRQYFEHKKDGDEVYDYNLHMKSIERSLKILNVDFSTLDDLDEEHYRGEIYVYSKRGILALLDFVALEPSSKFTFEWDLEKVDDSVRGRIDCLIEFGNQCVILDFKRSKQNTMNLAQILECKTIQLPFYVNHLGRDYQKVMAIGYLTLGDIDESVILATNDDYYAAAVEFIPYISDRFCDDYLEFMDHYHDFERETVKHLLTDTEFIPSGEKCDYCFVANLCRRK